MPPSGPSVAFCHGPWSMRTSTALMPRPWAHATPPIAILPWAYVRRPKGVSMRAWVFTFAFSAQPRSVQYACRAAYVVAVRRVTHFVAPT